MEWVIHLLRQHSELAIFLTIAAGFWIGKIKSRTIQSGNRHQRTFGRSTGRSTQHHH